MKPANEDLKPVVVCPADSPEWLEQRNTGITATDAPKVLGINGTPLLVYSSKRGELPPERENKYMVRGRKWQNRVIEDFVEETGLQVLQNPCPLYRHPLHEFMLATPDVEALDVRPVGVEAKTTENYRLIKTLGEDGSDGVPDEWIIQTHQQMAVTGWELVYIPVLIGFEMRIFKVHRNEDLIEILVERESELWQRIQNSDPPEPDWEHETTPRVVQAMYGLTEKVIDMPDDGCRLVEEYEEIRKQMTALEKEYEEKRARVAHIMQDAAIARLPNGREVVRKQMPAISYVVEKNEHIRMYSRKTKGLK